MFIKAIFFLIMAALAVTPALAVPHDGVNGDWDITCHIVGYTVPGTMSLKVTDSVITGTVQTEHTGTGTITGTMKGGKISLTAKFEKHETIEFTGSLKDGKLEGEFKTEGNTGQWTAVPHKAS